MAADNAPAGSESSTSALQLSEAHSVRCSCCGLNLARRSWILLLLVALICTVVISTFMTQTIGKAIAAQGIQQAALSLERIDVKVDGTGDLQLFIKGRVASPSPFDATFYPMTAIIKMDLPADELEVASDSRGGLTALGVVSLPGLDVQGGKDLVLNFPASFKVENREVFGLAGKQFVLSNTTSWQLEATASVKAWFLNMFPISLSGIPFRKSVEIQGMGGFLQNVNPITMNGLTKAYGDENSLRVSVSINVFNPSYLAARVVPSMHLDITQRGRHFGVASLSDVTLGPGSNTLLVDFDLEYNGDNRDAIRDFITGYVKADKVEPVTMHGSRWSTQDPYLGMVLDGLDFSFNFKPPGTQFIHGLEATVGFSGLSAEAVIYNPLPRGIVMGDMNLAIRENNAKGEEIFSLDTKKSSTRVPGQVLQPSQTTTLHISLSLFDAHLTDLMLLSRLIRAAHMGRVKVGVVGPVTVTILPKFTMTLDYSADDLIAKLKCPVVCGVDFTSPAINTSYIV